MIFTESITHFPVPFEPELGVQVSTLYDALPDDAIRLVTGIAGSSPYLRQLLERHCDWLLDHWQETPEDAVKAAMILAGDIGPALRISKGRVALVLALCDLSHMRAMEWVTDKLTEFADFAVETALNAELRVAVDQGKLKGATLNDGAAAGVFVLAMGKMGAHELNYSSDIDLIFLFDDSLYPLDEVADYRSIFVKVTQRVFALLSKATVDGYVFRTDLRLRPNPSVTVVCPAMRATEGYYLREGRTWERAAFIKARVCAGNMASGQGFLNRMQDFIWRRHLDFAALGEIEGLLTQSREHKGLTGPVTLKGHNMKLGRGGIREIEFFAQAHQMIFGGRHNELREISTQGALRVLANDGRISRDKADMLVTALRHHRKIEHRIQMLRDAQTHSIPTNPEDLERLRALSGYETVDDFATDVVAQLQITRDATDTLAPSVDPSVVATPKQLDRFDQWRVLPAFRNERAVDVFEGQLPHIWALAQNSSNPEQALEYFESFLSGLNSGVQLFSLFERKPEVLEQVFHVTSLSKQLGTTLARQVLVLDGLADTGPDAIAPDVAGYHAGLAERLPDGADFETVLIEMRAWKSEEQFKIVYAQLTQLIPTKRAEQAFTDLAEVCLQVCLDQSVSEAQRRWGGIAGSSVAVLAMGKMGSRQMTANSDLDVIVIYDGDPDAVSSVKALDIRTYYQRVTRTLVSALSSSMTYGRLYEVDMRLRPSGRAGTVATSLAGFTDYQHNKAWVWEHLALTRARVVAGDADLCLRIADVRRDVLSKAHDRAKVSKEVREMRERIAQLRIDKPHNWPVKKPLGGVLDLELLAQSLSLLDNGNKLRPLDQFRHALAQGAISPADADRLTTSLNLFTKIEHLKRLLGVESFDTRDLSDAAASLFTTITHIGSLSLIEQRIEQDLSVNAALITKVMEKLSV
jgi:glutamate-ammonia-ligase adenylyltransferase